MKDDRKNTAPLVPLLAVIFLLFIGIMVFVYIVSKQANPQMIRGRHYLCNQSRAV